MTLYTASGNITDVKHGCRSIRPMVDPPRVGRSAPRNESFRPQNYKPFRPIVWSKMLWPNNIQLHANIFSLIRSILHPVTVRRSLKSFGTFTLEFCLPQWGDCSVMMRRCDCGFFHKSTHSVDSFEWSGSTGNWGGLTRGGSTVTWNTSPKTEESDAVPIEAKLDTTHRQHLII